MRRLARLWLPVLALASLAAAACGPSGREETPIDVAARGPAAPSLDAGAHSGRYEVRGVTVQALSGLQREISGTLDLDLQGDRYEVRFELGTTAPDSEEEVPVRIRGTGHGLVVGKIFTGTTEEWMTLTPPPGGLDRVPLRGVELPSRAGRKLVSTSRGSFDDGGSFHVLLENYPGPGEHYEPSMTVLEARRAGAPPAQD